MHGSVPQSEAQVAAGEKVIVLLLPEALGNFSDTKLLAETLKSRPSVRVLLCLPDASGHHFIGMLEEIGIDTEILLGNGVTQPVVKHAFVLSAPRGMKSDDLVELALALSDAVLVPSLADEGRLSRSAKRLGKQRIVPGTSLAENQRLESVTRFLDADVPGLHSAGRRCFGRFEQAVLEIFAFNWLGTEHGGRAENRKKLWRTVGLAWRPDAYFPSAWKELVLDDTAENAASRIVAGFDAMDRSALYGSYFHRDITWIVNFLAAFAILAAVIGYLKHGQFLWGLLEIISLVVIAVLIILSRRIRLQDTWTACRLGAEQLRIARMSLPLLVLPPALATSDQPEEERSREDADFRALSEVKRVVRNHGLPRLRADLPFTPQNAAKWVQLIVSDQVNYHRSNHEKLECFERRIRKITEAMFWIILGAVLIHLVTHAQWLLAVIGATPARVRTVLTYLVEHAYWLFVIIAAGPAFAAALHVAATRLGIVHRIALSRGVERELQKIDEALVKLINAPLPDEQAWPAVRDLTYQAAEAMGRENMSWHVLVLRYRDVL